MRETEEDLAALQRLLDDSYAASGPHLRRIITAERRLAAEEVASRLDGMTLLALATVTADGRPIVGPVDGIFYRGAYNVHSFPPRRSSDLIRRRPHVSATHLPGEELAVTVHGRAVPIDVNVADHAGFRAALLDIYVPRYGPEWEKFLHSGVAYARIDADRMFTFHT
jgi:nitroimidazol reductase NimA-like FMN-containing flavoprotein (pyridoxamine 5'-phosphate oxidase superfamily)